MATNEDLDCPPAYTPVATASTDPDRPLPDYSPVSTASRDPDRPLPDYTKFAGWTESFTFKELGAPLACHPDYEPEPKKPRNGVYSPLSKRQQELLQRRRRTFEVLWRAIRLNDTKLIHKMMEADGIISPCALGYRGSSPLTTAVSYGDPAVVRLLVSLGADVNGLAVGGLYGDTPLRTPLQEAASKGHLTIVRCLMEEYGADDAVIAPDGQLALRLAGDAGCREIMEYLPSRRGGGWRRWKAQHSKAMKKAGKAGRKIAKFLFTLFCDVPYRVLLWGPYKVGGWVWRHKTGIAGTIAGAVIRIPGFAYRTVKELPREVARLVGWLWKVTKKAPEKINEVAEILGSWLGRAVRELGSAVGHIFGRLFSVLHTIGNAILRLKNLTLQDVWNGFCMLFRAVFVNLPRTVVRKLDDLAEASYEALKTTLGVFGKVAWWIIRTLVGVIVYIPVQLVPVMKGFARSMATGFKEVMVWYDPKRS